MPQRTSRHIIRLAAGALLGVAIGAVYGIAMHYTNLWGMRPPLYKEYHQIENEIYARYLADGRLPAASELSVSAQSTLSQHPEIQYSAQKGLGYQYGKPYPSNIPLTGLVTFGLCRGGEGGCLGEERRPNDLIHNAKLRASTKQGEGR